MGLQFGLYLSVNLGEPQPPSIFSEMFQRQQATLEKVEEEEGANEKVHAQVFFYFYLLLLLLISNTHHSIHPPECAMANIKRASGFQSLQCHEPSSVNC